jgi:hypothetical protein
LSDISGSTLEYGANRLGRVAYSADHFAEAAFIDA